jgi:hypothetical protein
LDHDLDDLERRLTDRDALIAILAPVLGDVIRRKIRDARDEMVEALYPIIGQVVVRAVQEAIRDLARNIDARMRSSFNVASVWRRWRARLGGASGAEISLRESLPFSVEDVLLVHRESGLLLWHVSRDSDALPDSDIISGMLTAVRDFAQDAFGQGKEEELDVVEFGERRILIEAARHAYAAVVVDGIEPTGFRAEMRERIIEIDHAHEETLRHYDGDPTPLAPVEVPLRSLISATESQEVSPGQIVALVAVVCLIAACVVAVFLAAQWSGWP